MKGRKYSKTFFCLRIRIFNELPFYSKVLFINIWQKVFLKFFSSLKFTCMGTCMKFSFHLEKHQFKSPLQVNSSFNSIIFQTTSKGFKKGCLDYDSMIFPCFFNIFIFLECCQISCVCPFNYFSFFCCLNWSTASKNIISIDLCFFY